MSATDESEVARFLDMARAGGRPKFEDLPVAEESAAYRAGRDTMGLPPVAIGNVIDTTLPGRSGIIPVRRYLPRSRARKQRPAILFFHGGGWVIGDLDTHDAICRHLVLATGLQVIAVDYRLAPEHRFPAAVEDAVDAHGMLIERAAEWRIDPTALAVAGDSAGGALALVSAISARDLCRPMPAAQLMFYPVADLRGGTRSYSAVCDVPITGHTMAWFRDQYLGDTGDAGDWRTSPLLAESLAGLSPTFIAIAGRDPLHDEGLALAERLRAAGGAVVVRHLPHLVHGYLTLGRMLGEAKRSIDAAAAFLAAALNRGTS